MLVLTSLSCCTQVFFSDFAFTSTQFNQVRFGYFFYCYNVPGLKAADAPLRGCEPDVDFLNKMARADFSQSFLDRWRLLLFIFHVVMCVLGLAYSMVIVHRYIVVSMIVFIAQAVSPTMLMLIHFSTDLAPGVKCNALIWFEVSVLVGSILVQLMRLYFVINVIHVDNTMSFWLKLRKSLLYLLDTLDLRRKISEKKNSDTPRRDGDIMRYEDSLTGFVMLCGALRKKNPKTFTP